MLSDETKEGMRNAASDDYFAARPHIDSRYNRCMFEAGFDRACRAIEAAVLEAQKQEPVGYFSKEDRDHYEPIWEEVTGPEFGIPLYAAPVVQPDIDVLAEYTGQDGKREWKDVGAWLRPGDVIAVLAAAEGKP